MTACLTPSPPNYDTAVHWKLCLDKEFTLGVCVCVQPWECCSLPAWCPDCTGAVPPWTPMTTSSASRGSQHRCMASWQDEKVGSGRYSVGKVYTDEGKESRCRKYWLLKKGKDVGNGRWCWKGYWRRKRIKVSEIFVTDARKRCWKCC